MKYYVYISDAKLEMLYEQIPSFRREKIGYELGIDLKLINLKFSKLKNESSRSYKIRMIERFLSRKTGSILEPKSYFAGEMDMIFGPYHEYRDFIYFGGKLFGTHVGLGGTMINCIGTPHKTEENITSFSMSPDLVNALAKGKEIPSYFRGYTGGVKTADLNERAMAAVVVANDSLGYPKQRMKFLAKRFIYGALPNADENSVLIGSPIYVAYAD